MGKIKNINFVIDCMINVQLNNLNKISEEIGLLKHYAFNFEKMDIFNKNKVIKDLNEKMKKSTFWDGDYIEIVRDE